MKFLKVLFYPLLLLIVFLFAGNVFACSCGAKSSALDSFENSDLVVVVKVISVQMRKEAKGVDLEAGIKKAGYDNTDSYVKSTRVKVEKVYKGNVKIGDELLFGQGGGADCVWTFGIKSVGESFLFYLNKPSTQRPWGDDDAPSKIPMYYGFTCGRSQEMQDYETDDLKYLNKIEKVKGKTRISGELNCWSDPCPDVANVTIKITGEDKTYETKTDENGVYEIYDVPPGKYLLNPEISKGWKVDQFMLQYSPAFSRSEYSFYDKELDFSKGVPLNLAAGKHNGIDFYFEIDAAIRGKVLSPDGKPMKDVCVRTVLTELKEGDYRGQSNCTNEDGIFIISEVSPGKYILVANYNGKISPREPFKTYFYGNTAKYGEAKTLEVKLGDHLDGFTIQIPKVEDLVTLSGRLIYSNGAPAASENVRFDSDEKISNIEGEQSIYTDKDGNFSFKILKGYKGKLSGKVYVYKGKYGDCSQYFAGIKKNLKGKDSGYLTTPEIQIDGMKDVSGLIVKFDFPGCKKSE